MNKGGDPSGKVKSRWWRSRTARSVGLVAAAIGLGVGASAGGRSEAQAPARAAAEEVHLLGIVGEAPLDADAIAAIRERGRRPFAVTLATGSRVVVIVDRVEEQAQGGKARAVTLVGHIEGEAGSAVIITTVGQAIAGTLRGKGDLVHVFATSKEGRPVVRGIDPRKLPSDDPALPRKLTFEPPKPDRNRNADTCTTDDPTRVQALILYSKPSRLAAGGVDAMEATIYAALAELNQANIDSDVASQYELVHLREVDYTAAGTETDLQRLHDAGDGFLDGVQALRDLYRADVVGMVVENFDFCGSSYGAVYGSERDVVRDPGNVHEGGAYVVFQLGCIQSNLTFAHEFAHLGSARHGWAADSSDNRPTHSNHGHVAGGSFRTIMAVPFDGAAPRVANFSNPAIARAGIPTGNAAEPQPTDNHGVLNLTTPILANYRCSVPPATNVWMKDTWGDTGAEPNADPGVMYASPYIWTRGAQDTLIAGTTGRYAHEHQHQNPVIHQPTWAYVKIHNGGAAAASGTLKIYYANASSSLVWPAGFTMIGDQILTLDPHSTKVAEFSWPDPPGSGHYCMIARWESAADPMAVAETSDINANTRNNNNVVWRNMDIAGLGGDTFKTSFEARSVRGKGFWLHFRALGAKPFLPGGIVRFTLSVDGKPYQGQPAAGIEPEGDGYRVHTSGASIFFALPRGVTGVVDLEFARTAEVESRHHRFEIDQLEVGKSGAPEVLGGMAYDVDATPTAPKP